MQAKTVIKWIGGGVGVLGLVIGGGLSWLMLARPLSAAPSTESIESTPERLARGEYLAENLAGCMHCHSIHDDTRLGMPIDGEMLGGGGITLDQSVGLPGVITPPNITPHLEAGLGGWTDGEIIRAIREGIGRDGRALFPMMPYATYRTMSDEDVRSIVVYLRSIPARSHQVAPVELDFPVNLFIRMVPEPVESAITTPLPTDGLAYGEYLVELALCEGCHTPIDDRGQGLAGMEFAGGREFVFPGPEPRTRVVTSNITPDPITGYFGRNSKSAWIERVHGWRAIADDPPEVAPGSRSLMPWLEFSRLSDEDLGAIWEYMQTIDPVEHAVVAFPDAADAALPTTP